MREADFKREVQALQYPESIKTEFFEYWTEPNKSGTKMRFEMEKTWHLGRRLARWAANGFNSIKNTQQQIAKPVANKQPVTEAEKLDVFISGYCERPSEIPFEAFGKWYDFMKAEGLLKTLSEEEKQMLKNVYGNNGGKLKAAWVQKTLDGFVNTGLKVSDIMKLRQRLNA